MVNARPRVRVRVRVMVNGRAMFRFSVRPGANIGLLLVLGLG